MRGYLPLTVNDFVTTMDGLEVYEKEGILFTSNLSLENSKDPFLCSLLALFHSLF